MRAALQAEGERIAVDLCSGSGAIAISLATEVEGSEVHLITVQTVDTVLLQLPQAQPLLSQH